MSQETPAFLENHENESREDLRALADLLNLTILREAKIGATPTIVVKNKANEEVHIGFPYGRTSTHGVIQKPSTTKRIEGVKMNAVGDGPWLFEIDI